MRRLVAICFLGFTWGSALAAGGGVPLEHADIDPTNTSSLQRGAKYFVNYCQGCHSAQYVRYNRLGEDLGISEDQLVANLMFAAEKSHEPMEIAMRPADAERWFGIAPPDLSLIARSKSPDYLFTYLKSFYVDDDGSSNNLILKGTSMPHVLWELQGLQKAVFTETTNDQGVTEEVFEGFEQISDGKVSPAEYDEVIRDIVNFLEYIGEPVKLQREEMGIYVLAFLFIFLLVAYFLKKEIWTDVH